MNNIGWEFNYWPEPDCDINEDWKNVVVICNGKKYYNGLKDG